MFLSPNFATWSISPVTFLWVLYGKTRVLLSRYRGYDMTHVIWGIRSSLARQGLANIETNHQLIATTSPAYPNNPSQLVAQENHNQVQDCPTEHSSLFNFLYSDSKGKCVFLWRQYWFPMDSPSTQPSKGVWLLQIIDSTPKFWSTTETWELLLQNLVSELIMSYTRSRG